MVWRSLLISSRSSPGARGRGGGAESVCTRAGGDVGGAQRRQHAIGRLRFSRLSGGGGVGLAAFALFAQVGHDIFFGQPPARAGGGNLRVFLQFVFDDQRADGGAEIIETRGFEVGDLARGRLRCRRNVRYDNIGGGLFAGLSRDVDFGDHIADLDGVTLLRRESFSMPDLGAGGKFHRRLVGFQFHHHIVGLQAKSPSALTHLAMVASLTDSPRPGTCRSINSLGMCSSVSCSGDGSAAGGKNTLHKRRAA